MRLQIDRDPSTGDFGIRCLLGEKNLSLGDRVLNFGDNFHVHTEGRIRAPNEVLCFHCML